MVSARRPRHTPEKGDLVRFCHPDGGHVEFDDETRRTLQVGETAFVIEVRDGFMRLLHLVDRKESSMWMHPSQCWEKVDG